MLKARLAQMYVNVNKARSDYHPRSVELLASASSGYIRADLTHNPIFNSNIADAV
jgi:hypothetical protein